MVFPVSQTGNPRNESFSFLFEESDPFNYAIKASKKKDRINWGAA